MRAGFIIRQASLDDAAVIAAHRRSMFADMGRDDAAMLDAMTAAFEPWVRRKMASGEYLAWFAIAADGAIAAGIGLWVMDWPPHVISSGAARGNLLNVYVRPEDRRQGLARELMKVTLDWCAANGIDCVILHSSPAGRPLYESLGFTATNEMRLMLPV